MKVAREQLSDLVEAILSRHGVPSEHGRIQAKLFIGAQMRGIVSHGLLRLRRVVERLEAGLIVAGEIGRHDWTAGSFLSVDGQRGLGPVVALKALDAVVIPRARETGIAIAAIRNANHLGALAYYADYVARQGLYRHCPHHQRGAGASLWRPPGDDRHQSHRHWRSRPNRSRWCWTWRPARVSMGKIHDHSNRGAAIPEGWALDAAGNSTTDADAAKGGAIAPFGGAKGYALGLAFEVLVASLAESAIGRGVKGTLDSGISQQQGAISLSSSLRPMPRRPRHW